MSLSSIYDVAKRLNILQQVVDENVGTGTGSEADFDLDNDNVIPTSYTLSYAATTGATNTFTNLTESTHYTLDAPSGRIVLNATGMSTLSTNYLFANYYYLTKLTAAQITDFLTRASARLDEITGRKWSTSTYTEYLDGKARLGYPRTDRPFMSDRAEYDSINLKYWPVQSLQEIHFLNRHLNTWSSVLSDDGGSFTDNTSEANEVGGTAFDVLASTPASNDALYLGLPYKFLGAVTTLQTLGVDGGSLAVTWEYYNGSTWASLSNVTAGTTGSDDFTASGKVTWDLPSAWTKTTVNGSNSLYFVRARLSAGSYSTAPTMWESYPDPNSVLQNEVSLRNVDFERWGELTFLNETISDGIRNIRVKYVAGVTSADEEYQLGYDLEVLLAALMCAVSITGGSFDDETSLKLGEKQVTIGESYVNVAEVVKQLQTEITELKRLLGERVVVA